MSLRSQITILLVVLSIALNTQGTSIVNVARSIGVQLRYKSRRCVLLSSLPSSLDGSPLDFVHPRTSKYPVTLPGSCCEEAPLV